MHVGKMIFWNALYSSVHIKLIILGDLTLKINNALVEIMDGLILIIVEL